MRFPIALQLYSVRTDCAADFLGVLEKVAKMGYDGVEFAGYHGHSPEALKKVLDANGLKAEGTHTPITDLSPENFQKTVDLHHTLECPWVIVPWIPEDRRNSAAACHEVAKELTELTHQLAEHKLRLGFHAHDKDMSPLDGGKSAWYEIAGGTPSSFIMQYDTANGKSGGADPVQPLLDWPGRGASTHLKGDGSNLVGEGDIPWAKVIEACRTVAGTEWLVIEHENEDQFPAMESVKRCLDNLNQILG